MPVPRSAEPDRLPPPSPELVILVALVEEFLAELPRKRRASYLARITTNLEGKADRSSILRIRPASDDPAVAAAATQALAFWRQVIGVLVSRMAGLE